MTEFKSSTIQDSNDKENARVPLSKLLISHPRAKILEEVVLSEFEESIKSIQNLKEVEYSTEDCLKIHRINEELRSKMVDWMVEVLSIFECSSRTLFLSIRLMDLFFKKETNTLGIEELHVIGVVCMMIASKYEDIKPLSMNTVYYKIGHERLPKSYLINVEKKVLQVVEYKVCIPTVLDFLAPLIENFDGVSKNYALFVAEIIQLDYHLAALKPSCVAQAIFSILSKNGRTFVSSQALFIVELIKNFLERFSYPFRASFVKYNQVSIAQLWELVRNF